MNNLSEYFASVFSIRLQVHMKNGTGRHTCFRQLKSWENLWSLFLGSKRGFIPFDCSTVGALLYADEFNIETEIPAFIKIDKNDTKYTVSTPTKQFFLCRSRWRWKAGFVLRLYKAKIQKAFASRPEPSGVSLARLSLALSRSI